MAIPEAGIRATAAMVASMVEATVGSGDRAAVMRLLADLGEDFRLQLGVLRLAKGQLSRVEELVAAAKIDSRDVLASAEYPREHEVTGNRTPPRQEDLEERRHADQKEYLAWLKPGL